MEGVRGPTTTPTTVTIHTYIHTTQYSFASYIIVPLVYIVCTFSTSRKHSRTVAIYMHPFQPAGRCTCMHVSSLHWCLETRAMTSSQTYRKRRNSVHGFLNKNSVHGFLNKNSVHGRSMHDTHVFSFWFIHVAYVNDMYTIQYMRGLCVAMLWSLTSYCSYLH